MNELGAPIAAGNNFAVFDDILTAPDFQAVWEYAQQEDFHFINSEKWTKVYRLGDGHPLRGPSYLSETASAQPRYNVYPTKKGIDLVIRRIQAAALGLEGLIGRLGIDWDFFSASAYLYPAGTQLSWHKDAAERSGEYIFYAHPRWNVQWGGELFVLDVTTDDLQVHLPEGCRPAPEESMLISITIFRMNCSCTVRPRPVHSAQAQPPRRDTRRHVPHDQAQSRQRRGITVGARFSGSF